MNPLSRYYARTRISDSFSANLKPLNDLQFQQNLLHSQVMDQMQPAMPSLMLGNITQHPKLVADSCLQPETNRMEFQAVNSRGQIVNDYMAISPQIPYFGSGYQYPSPRVKCPLPGNFSGYFDVANMTTFGGQARSEMNESAGNKQIIPNDNQHNFSSQDNDLSAILNELGNSLVPDQDLATKF
ncbi:two-component response regulator ARR18-like [Forsythia ovata]|uniref:Two-component response regulator ARR18-like n=1 Tax=Forsythia ovata TaxID=205694 RepID=A0ABD1S6B5_9LAMI